MPSGGRSAISSAILIPVAADGNDVHVSVPDVERWQDCTQVQVNGILSTARTVIKTIGHLKATALALPAFSHAAPACHDFRTAGAGRIITCNTIKHDSNVIDISGLLVEAVCDLFG